MHLGHLTVAKMKTTVLLGGCLLAGFVGMWLYASISALQDDLAFLRAARLSALQQRQSPPPKP